MERQAARPETRGAVGRFDTPAMNDEIKTRWSSRKYWSAMVWQIVFTILVVKKVVTGDTYATLTFITLGGYYAANVMMKKCRALIAQLLQKNDASIQGIFPEGRVDPDHPPSAQDPPTHT